MSGCVNVKQLNPSSLILVVTKDLFAQLKPILGQQIVRLQMAYATANEDGRKDLSLLLELLAHKVGLGITPPPEAIAKGEYPVGTVIDAQTPLYPFGLCEKDWFHIGVFGMTGRGKTNTVLRLLQSLNAHGKKWLVFDWKRSGYRDLINTDKDLWVFTVGRDVTPFFFNPLTPPPGVETITWIKQFISCLSHAYFLGHGCEMILADIVHPDRTPTLSSVLKALGSYPATWRKLHWLQSTERAIKALCYGGIDTVFNSLAHQNIDDLLDKNVVFELDALSDSEAKFFVEILMSAIYLYRKAARHSGFKHVCVIEEAHHVLRTESDAVEQKSVMDKLFREIREYGESLVIVDQMPAEILGAAIANTTTKIVLSLNRSQDVKAVGQSMLLGHHEQTILGRLPVGEAVVKLEQRWHAPFIISIPKIEVGGAMMTDSMITKQMTGYFAKTELKSLNLSKPEVISPLSRTDKREKTEPKIGENAITKPEMVFLFDIVKHPFSTTTQRYKRLDTNPRRGNQIKSHLLKKGFITDVGISTATGQVKLLQLTQSGCALLPKKRRQSVIENPSLTHQYWVNEIKQVLEKNDYAVFLEHRFLSGGVVDLYATKAKINIAVEVETSKSDVLHNVRKCMNANVNHLIIAATTKSALAKMKAQLANANLPHNRAPLLIIQACTISKQLINLYPFPPSR